MWVKKIPVDPEKFFYFYDFDKGKLAKSTLLLCAYQNHPKVSHGYPTNVGSHICGNITENSEMFKFVGSSAAVSACRS